MQLIVRDEAACAQYGEYPKPVTFAQAVNLADLERLALEYLEQNSGPLEALTVKAAFEAGYDPQIEQGDTVTFASLDAGINVTERIVEINYDADGVSFSLKAPKADLTQAILDKFDEGERAARALGLPAPVGFAVTGARPGVRLKFNPFVGSRAQGTEIHASLEPNFTPDALTFVKRTSDTEVHLSAVSHLPLGTRWYLKVASYAGAERGEFTEELSAIAGYITTDVLDPSIEEKLDKAASDERISELLEEVEQGKIYTGTVGSFSVDAVTDFNQDFGALGVQPGWNLKLLSGPLKYRSFTVTGAVGNTLTVSPNIPSNIILSGSTYEVASSPRITTLGTTGIVVELSKPPSESTFSSIKQMSDEIALAVVRDQEQYAQLSILEDELDLRVVKGDMISAINLDPAGVRIVGNRIQLSGDTQVTGNLAITGGVSGTGNRVRVLDSGNQEQTAFGYIAGRPWGSDVLPANTWGMWAQNGGVYLRGVPKLVSVGSVDAYFDQLTVRPTDSPTLNKTKVISTVPFDVKKGERIFVQLSLSRVTTDPYIVLSGIYLTPLLDVGAGFINISETFIANSPTRVNRFGAEFSLEIRNDSQLTRNVLAFVIASYQIYTVG